MDKLPNEVLYNIFQDSHLFQKQEYMLVCRRWLNLIRPTIYLSTIHITSRSGIDQLFELLSKKPAYGHQIRHLILHDYIFVDTNDRDVVEYFTNLRSLRLKFSDIMVFHTGVKKDGTPLIDMKTWGRRIETIEFDHIYANKYSILVLGTFPSLKHLALNGRIFERHAAKISENTPNLKSLKLIDIAMSLKELALLHSRWIGLESLELEKATLTIVDVSDRLVAPNSASLKTLLIHFTYSTEEPVTAWLNFITRNYTSLTDFQFIFYWAPYIHQHNEENITKNGLVPLLNKLGHKLKYLDITNSFGVPTILQTLNKLNLDLQTLHIRLILSTIRQPLSLIGIDLSRYIHHLTIFLSTDRSLEEPHNLKSFPVLKTLHIGYRLRYQTESKTLLLTHVLDSCPDQLESLDIYEFMVDGASTTTRYPSLKRLGIHNDRVPSTVYPFISSCLPGLKHLTIDQRDAPQSEPILLDSKDLNYLDISTKFGSFVSLKTLKNPELCYYPIGPYKRTEIMGSRISINPRGINRRIMVEEVPDSEETVQVACRSVKSLVINNQLAF